MTTDLVQGSAPELKLTDEQQAIIEATPKGGSLMIEAGAGCAKTSTAELAVKRVRVPALALAFGKRDAERMKGKFPSNFECRSFNSLGHGAWGKTLGRQSIKLDDKKVGRLLSAHAKRERIGLTADDWDQARRMVSVAMQQGLVPSSEDHQSLVEDSEEGWWEVADAVGVLRDDFPLLHEVAREVLIQSIAEARAGVISYDDQIYCSTMLGGQFGRFPFIFVDEDQDLSPLNHLMLSRSCSSAGRIMAVGDQRQAIYAFRGASGRSAAAIRAIRPEAEWKDFPLMTTFRCPKLVVQRQQLHVPGFRAHHSNAQGAIIDHRQALEQTDDEYEGWNWPRVCEAHASHGGSGQIAVLCRNNGPLLSLAFKLLRQGVGVVMTGRDIGKGLAVLSKKIAKEDSVDIAHFLGRLKEWEDGEVALLTANGKDEKIAGVQDKAECLRAVAIGGSCSDAGQVRARLSTLFARESGTVVLSSIHRAKGAEWSTVVLLDPWRLPSKWARRAAERGDKVPLEQELNLRYVAETRTKHSLILANLQDWSTP